MALKNFDETFSGWGAEGYNMETAIRVAEDIRSQMRDKRGIKEIKVEIVPMLNGNFKVANKSTYESQWG